MKKLISILIIVIFTTIGCKKDNPIPTKINPFPFENNNLKMEIVSNSIPGSVTDIYFFNETTGLAITFNGEIYKTTNKGITWTLKFTNPTPNQPLFHILFTDQNIGYVVGGAKWCNGTGCNVPGGLVLKTTDGGDNWTNIFQMNNVEFVSAAANTLGDIFIISNGTKGRIIKSSNGGINWLIIDSTNFQLQKITFYNNYGSCIGGNGYIKKSNDNGNTWNQTDTLNSLYASDIKFTSGIGFFIANTIYKTNDNGNNWTSVFSSDKSNFKLNLLSNSNCLVWGAGQYSGGCFGTTFCCLRQSVDGGGNWTELQFSEISTIRYTSFYNSTNGYVGDGMYLIKVTIK